MNSTARRNLLFWILYMIVMMLDPRFREGYILFYPELHGLNGIKRNNDPGIEPQPRHIKSDNSNSDWIYNMIRSY